MPQGLQALSSSFVRYCDKTVKIDAPLFKQCTYNATVKPVTRGHLNVEIGMSKLHFL